MPAGQFISNRYFTFLGNPDLDPFVNSYREIIPVIRGRKPSH